MVGSRKGALMAQDARVQEFVKSFQSLHSEVQKVIVGHDDVILSVLVGLFAGGHVLLEGAPGLGKTLLVRTLAEGLELSFSRIQFTPDLMPADIVGTNIIVEDTSGRKRFEFQQGPIVSHVRDMVSLIVMTTHPAFEHAPDVTRRFVRYGSSPRGAQAMVLGAKVLALSQGRYNVSAEDIRAMAAPALRHRIILNFEGEAEGVDSDTIVARAVESAERLAVREKEVFLR